MDVLRQNVRTLYLRTLTAAFGSTLITSIYSIVDKILLSISSQYEREILGSNGDKWCSPLSHDDYPNSVR